MRHVGRAFLYGFGGALGAGTAFASTAYLVGRLSERAIKRHVRTFSEHMQEQTEALLRERAGENGEKHE